MRIAIIQMSDLHIKSASDYIVKQSASLARAIAAKINSCNKVIIVVTGDIIDRGIVSNYEHAYAMFNNFETEIRKEAQIDNWNYVLVPGNHDLDFSMDVPFRDMVIKDALSSGDISREEHKKEVLKPQSEFWKFYSKISNTTKEPCISFSEQIEINNNSSVVFHCYNTACLSKKDELPQSLIVPENCFQFYEEKPDRNDIVISIYHHKTGWLTTKDQRNNSRRFSEHIQKQSQILMCGHEHQQDSKKISDFQDNKTVLYLESNSMQQGDEQSFSLITIDDNDLSTINYTTISIDASKDDCLPADDIILSLPHCEHSFSFSETYYKVLHSLEAPIKHPHKEQLYLEDIYVYPDLEPVNTDLDDEKISAYLDAGDLLNMHSSGKIIVLEGENQCGKTALLKMLTQQCYYRSIYPIFLRGKDIENIKVRTEIVKAYNYQYKTSLKTYHEYMTLEREKRIIFIDNIDKSRLNETGKKEMCLTLLKDFDRVIVTTSENIGIDSVIHQYEDKRNIFAYVIHPLGYVKRNALIEKWVLLGSNPYTIDPNVTFETIKSIYDQITNILGKQLLPSNPIFLLTLIQNINIDSIGFDVAPTSYAALYDSLLSAAMVRAGIAPNKVSGYAKFLSELAYEMFKLKIEILSEKEVHEAINYYHFYNSYKQQWIPPAESEVLLNIFKKSCVIVEIEQDVYKFSYKYLFFYLTAKKIAEIIHKEEGKKIVQTLCKDLHKEDNAFILLFLAYLDNSDVLLDEIKFTSMLPFEQLAPITLNNDDDLYNKLSDLVNSMKEDVLKAGVNPHEHRRKQLEAHDKEDRIIQRASASETIPSQEEVENDKDIVDLRNVVFVTQVLGQIVKNQQETLRINVLIGLIEDAYNSTFRSVSFFTQLIEKNRKLFIDEITGNPQITKAVDEQMITDRLNRLLQIVLLKFCLLSFTRLSLAVGTSGNDMSEIYDKVADNIGSPAAALISFTIKTYYGKMNVTELKTLVKKYRNNPVVLRLINARVRGYVYNHELTHDRISELGSITGMKLINTSSTAYARRNLGK